MKIVKEIRRQDCNWKQAAGCSGETSINLSNEILDFLTDGSLDYGEETIIPFVLYKEDFLTAFDFLLSQMPLYRSSSRNSILVRSCDQIVDTTKNSIHSFFGKNDTAIYPVFLYRRTDGRIYLKGLKQKGFTIRDFLVEYSSSIEFNITNGQYCLRLLFN